MMIYFVFFMCIMVVCFFVFFKDLRKEELFYISGMFIYSRVFIGFGCQSGEVLEKGFYSFTAATLNVFSWIMFWMGTVTLIMISMKKK